MDRIARVCEEIHAFGGTAERTGRRIEVRLIKARRRACSSVCDLMRKYRLYGDGYFYLPVGQWPHGVRYVDLDNVKWIGITAIGDTTH